MNTEKNSQKSSHKTLLKFTECAVMLALSIALSFIPIWKMPMGGEVTLLSMLPVILIALKYGTGTGLSTALVYSLFQLAQGFFSGNVFVYCKTPVTVIVVVLFDYIVPYTLLGFAGLLKGIHMKKFNNIGILAGIVLVIFLRFVCHYITGCTVWGQWAGDEGPYIYSLIYNGTYLLPECILTTAAGAILVKIPQIRKLLSLN